MRTINISQNKESIEYRFIQCVIVQVRKCQIMDNLSEKPRPVKSFRKSATICKHKASDTHNYGRRDLIGKRHAPRTIVTAVDVKSDLGFALFLSFALHIIDCNLV